MKGFAPLFALALLCGATLAPAQVQVSAQMSRSNFLLFERVDLLVTVVNAGDSDLTLANDEGHPWLSFLVTKHNRLPVRVERHSEFPPMELKVGESKTLRVNLTPLFSFREEGDYNAAAVVDLPGAGQIISPNVPFTVLTGRTVWTQLRPVDGVQRTYSLVRFSPDSDTTKLYLRVESVADNLVYTNLALGELASAAEPTVLFDPAGNLHILQSVAMGTYLYTRSDPDGKIMRQQIFRTDHEIPPRLAKVEDGNVIVAGGMPDSAEQPRERLSQNQAAPHPATFPPQDSGVQTAGLPTPTTPTAPMPASATPADLPTPTPSPASASDDSLSKSDNLPSR